MSRASISAQARAFINSPNCNVAFIALVEITHPDLDTLRIANDQTDVTHNGVVYTAMPFDIKMMDESQNELTTSQLKIFWVDSAIKDLVQAVNQSSGKVSVKWVVEGDWDTVQWSIDPPLLITKGSIVAGDATFDLGLKSLISQEVPVHEKGATTHPGLWANR